MRATATRVDEGEAAALWAASGAMALTGRCDGAAVVAPAALATAALRWAAELCALAQRADVSLALDGPALLGERAACAALVRRGRVSAGGSARLVRARDGWLAVNLPRPEDRAALPAWLEHGPIDAADPWQEIADSVRQRGVAPLVERARLLGLAVSEAAASSPHSVWQGAFASEYRRPAGARPRVVDLSSLWAGPLCGQLLGAAGASVVKVESRARPDGARFGPPAFFDLLNAGKQSVAVDLATPEGVAALRSVIGAADIVIESARPRALRQLGIDAAAEVAARGDLVWVSITAYGRAAPHGGWVGFGDDAAAAAGLCALAGRGDDGPLFCADAVADPLTGLFAAALALAAWQAVQGVLLDVALCDVAARALSAAPAPERWSGAVAPPRRRPAAGAARALGADTRALLGGAASSDWPAPYR